MFQYNRYLLILPQGYDLNHTYIDLAFKTIDIKYVTQRPFTYQTDANCLVYYIRAVVPKLVATLFMVAKFQ